MPRGLGSVYQRGSVWWIRYSVAGRELRESSNSEDRDDAVRLLKKRMGETAGIRERGGFVTFDGLRAMLVDDYRLNERASLPRAELALVKLRAALGGEKAERITVRNVRTGFMEADRFDAVLGALPEWARPVILFLFLTGWRKGDALGLQWRQVDLEHGSIVLEKGRRRTATAASCPSVRSLCSTP